MSHKTVQISRCTS